MTVYVTVVERPRATTVHNCTTFLHIYYYSLLRRKAATVKHTNITIHNAMQHRPKISQTINIKHTECQIHVTNVQYCKNTKTFLYQSIPKRKLRYPGVANKLGE